ncbi:MAG: hypothetical protein GOV01_03210 [Candidatus Altiarchaeota archaeon]|nr:hypothetical protein [Candidatus Altiarchaeota archaeon]
MRHLKFNWLCSEPTDKEIFKHLQDFLGVQGVIASGLRVSQGLVSCENSWLQKVRGAMALKWQFNARVSGTKKSLNSLDIEA